MASAVRRRRAEEQFRIHEDVPSTEDTEVNDESMDVQEDQDDQGDYDDDDDNHEDGEDQGSDISGSSAEEVLDTNVQVDMEKLQDSFPGFRHKYRLIKRIGEGMHPPVLHSHVTLESVDSTTLTMLHLHRHVLDRLQSRRPAVRRLRQHVGHREGEREVVNTTPQTL